MLHLERQQTYISLVLVQIEFEPVGQVAADSLRIDLPVQEGEMAPVLDDGMRSIRYGKRKMVEA